ncbi:sulfatase-like hydrolase/transferase [Kiritimatiella glycovorans]|uniref:Arylsulfatase n=1 Tax=Kiritimatiella glycovorans TaxID=1307763 RepID=A0A0G3EDI0_9BACT|nr:sulfatase-like hydrolase/transferase [Kiritimatiella glycovorans]AKJ63442.1 Arylsulfatase precursor [Kiritimatiella glycovorans]
MMRRRDFMAAAAAAGAIPALSAKGAKRRKPNLVLILADDLGEEALSCYGCESWTTPRLDQMADEGVRFTHAYANPLCAPSRVKIMTGRYNCFNYTAWDYLDPKETTFANLLREEGYATAMAGKWQLGGDLKIPDRFGFDEHCLWQIDDKRGSRFYEPLVERNGTWLDPEKQPYGPDLFCDFINDFILRKAREGQPFLAYFSMALVHRPFHLPPGYRAEGQEPNDPEGRLAYFKTMVEHMDRLVGYVLDTVDDAGVSAETLVLFVGDNGTVPLEIVQHGETVRGGKGKPTEQGTNVPLIARCPGSTPPGTVCGDLVDLSDFLPTLAEAGGAPVPDDVDGRSFLPQCLGREGNPRDWVFVHYNPRLNDKVTPARFVRGKRWKLFGDGRLFDLHNDPHEQNPVRPGEGDTSALQARRRLQPVLDRMPCDFQTE